MPMTFGKFRSNIDCDWKTSSGAQDLETVTAQGTFSSILNLRNGASADQINEKFDDLRTLAGGATDTLDLAGGVTNGYGQTVNFARIKTIYIENTSENPATKLIIGPTGANDVFGTSPALPISPGNRFVWEETYTGVTVTAGTKDLLRIQNADAANTAQFKVVITGVSI